MKRLLLSLSIVLLTATSCLAQDYWVFIRTYDRPGLTASDDVGRSKAGDIVLIEPAVEGQTPTPTEQKEYLIITVSDLTDAERLTLLSESLNIPFNENDVISYKSKAYRTKKFDFVSANKETKPGFNSTPIDHKKFVNLIKEKTSLDYAKYEAKRIVYAYLQYPLEKLDTILVPRAFASIVVSKICAVGANCTDENYNTLTAWEDAKDGNLVTATTIQEADVYNDDGDITDNFVVDGSTVSASYYMLITAPIGERHTGIINTGSTIAGSGNNAIVNSDDNNLEISWMEFDQSGATASVTSMMDHIGGVGMKVYNCLIYNYTTCNLGSGGAGCGVQGNGSIVSNNLFFNLGGSSERAVSNTGTTMSYVSNNTIFDVDTAFEITDANAKLTAYNNFIDDNGTDDDAFGECGGGSNNSTNDSTADNDADCSDGAVINYQMDTVVVNTTTNFHLLSTATSVIDAATDLGTSYNSNYDIDNFDRNGCAISWDIGFDEFATSCARRIMLIQ